MAWSQVRTHSHRGFISPGGPFGVSNCLERSNSGAGLTERQQLALALEESKKAAAALQAKDRQASKQMDSQVTLLKALVAQCCLLSITSFVYSSSVQLTFL